MYCFTDWASPFSELNDLPAWDQSLYGTEGVLRAPSVQDARNKDPQVSTLFFAGMYISPLLRTHQRRLPVCTLPQLLKKLPLYVFPSLFANSLPFCALMTSLSLIFFIQASIILSSTRLLRGAGLPHPHTGVTLKAPLASPCLPALLWVCYGKS